ncbi:MAG: hypothetical protein ACRD7E_27090 [Bryobacteraceae bacterium]
MEISVAFIDGVFDIATVYDGHVLGMSEIRCYNIVAAGEWVKARVERLKLGCLNEHERAGIRTRLLERQRTVAAELAALRE